MSPTEELCECCVEVCACASHLTRDVSTHTLTVSAVDITPPNHEELPADAPTVLVCHGLTGNASESYVRNVLAWVIKPKSEGGLGGRGVVSNVSGSQCTRALLSD